MEGKTILDFMFQSKLLKFLFLVTGLAITFMELQCEEIQTLPDITTFCYNSSLEGFRLNAKVLEVRNVSSRSACIDECLVDPCCRAVNYQYTTPHTEPYKCEFLHDLVHNTSSVLEKNISYDFVFFVEPCQPCKAYNLSCLSKEIVDDSKTTYVSCKDIFETNSSASNGVYTLQRNESSNAYQVYCHMSNISSQCGGGGWTLVMKLDGHKETFKYHSDRWKNKKTFNVEAGLTGLTENETKLASYDNTPFAKVCLGMKVKDVTNWIMINYTASSLHSVIADGILRKTNLGRAMWLSLMKGSRLQPNCGLEGFNVQTPKNKNIYIPRARIGIVGNGEKDCKTPDTIIGFGIKLFVNKEISNGHLYWKTKFQAFGYIFVQ